MAVSKIVQPSTSSAPDSIYFTTSTIGTSTVLPGDSIVAGRWTFNVVTTGSWQTTDIFIINSNGAIIASATATLQSTDYDLFVPSDASFISIIPNSSGTGTFTVQLTKVADLISAKTATLESVLTTQTYNQTGTAYVAVIGGGGGGGYRGPYTGGGGGGAGYLTTAIVDITSPVQITVGAGGSSPGVTSASGNSGGTSSFGNINAAGGGGGTGGNSGVANSPGGSGSSIGGRGGFSSHPSIFCQPGSRDGASSGVPLKTHREAGLAGAAGSAPTDAKGVGGGIYASGGGGGGGGPYGPGREGGGGGGGVAAPTFGPAGGPGGVYILRWQ